MPRILLATLMLTIKKQEAFTCSL